MTTFRIIDAKPYHCGQMCRVLRYEHQMAISRIGIDSHRELRGLFDQSSIRRAWLIDGKLGALGGVSGTKLSPYGFVWLALTQAASHYRVAIVKEAKKQLAEIMTIKRELATTIIAGDDAARRLAIFLGFHVADDGPGQPASSRFARRDLERFIASNPECRIPLGDSYAVAMGYHGEAA
jgi:hypothetical protein